MNRPAACALLLMAFAPASASISRASITAFSPISMLLRAPEILQTQAWVVGTYTSTAEENRDAFVLRMAGQLQAWTDQTRLKPAVTLPRMGKAVGG